MITLMRLPGLESEYTGGWCCFYLRSTVLGGAVKTPSSGIGQAPAWDGILASLGHATRAGALWSCGVRVGL